MVRIRSRVDSAGSSTAAAICSYDGSSSSRLPLLCCEAGPFRPVFQKLLSGLDDFAPLFLHRRGKPFALKAAATAALMRRRGEVSREELLVKKVMSLLFG
jgi:hypothetical protein